MSTIAIPDHLSEALRKIAPPAMSPEAFVIRVLEDRLQTEERKREFFALSDRARQAMAQMGLRESDLLSEFESSRRRGASSGH